jgi:peptidylprolyl isomerase|tara:strand:- start:184 stop:597 length:414 start_codon:yes stop_codon:yes gene_type:complete
MIEKGSKVKVHYTGKLNDNEIFDSSKDKEPLEFTVGEGQLIPGFENGVMGLNAGDKKTIELEPEQAYGPVREELVNEVPKENLPEGVEVGSTLQAQTEQGPVMVRVVELNETIGKVDANHPLAGKKLIFDLEVVEVG